VGPKLNFSKFNHENLKEEEKLIDLSKLSMKKCRSAPIQIPPIDVGIKEASIVIKKKKKVCQFKKEYI
jgi:hypothetical protein